MKKELLRTAKTESNDLEVRIAKGTSEKEFVDSLALLLSNYAEQSDCSIEDLLDEIDKKFIYLGFALYVLEKDKRKSEQFKKLYGSYYTEAVKFVKNYEDFMKASKKKAESEG